jgi:hypothetical protein
MASRALLSEYFASVTDAAASRRQIAAIAADIDQPAISAGVATRPMPYGLCA